MEPFDKTQGRQFGTSGTGSVFGKHQGSLIPLGLKKGIRKLSQERLFLLTCLLMVTRKRKTQLYCLTVRLRFWQTDDS